MTDESADVAANNEPVAGENESAVDGVDPTADEPTDSTVSNTEPGMAEQVDSQPRSDRTRRQPSPPDLGESPRAVALELPGHANDRERLDAHTDEQAVRQEGVAILNGSVTSSGATTIGGGVAVHADRVESQEIVVNIGGRQVRILKSLLREERVRREAYTYVTVDTFEEMASALRQMNLIVSRSASGSGRWTTSVVVLEKVCGPKAVGTLVLDPSHSLADLHHSAGILDRGHGFVLDVSGRPLQLDQVEALSALAHTRNAYLVLLAGPAAPRDDALPQYEFQHMAPLPREVLGRHLTTLVDDHLSRCPGRICSPERAADYVTRAMAEEHVQDRVKLQSPPRLMVELATLLATGLHDGKSIDELVARHRLGLRAVAEMALKEADPAADEYHRPPRPQAFRIAFAVFQGFPLTDVFETGELLYQKILPNFETRGAPLSRTVFDGGLEHLIHPEMCATTVVPDAYAPQRARLVDPTLTRLVLDVAWHDFDTTREPIIAWLDSLAGHDRPRIRVRAAQAAGILLTFDFEEIYRKLIRAWARKRAAYRQAASDALEIAFDDPRIADRIHRQLRDWVGSPDPWVQDSAVRGYGSSIGAAEPEAAIGALHTLAGRAQLTASNSVAFALARLFSNPQLLGDGRNGLVLDAIGEWIVAESEYVRRHAARAMVVLAQLVAADATTVPVLPVMAAGNSRLQDSLVELWRGALISAETARRAWEPLRRWLLSADDGDDQLADVIEPMALRIFTEPLIERAAFNLTIWASRSPDSTILQRLLKVVSASGPRRNGPFSPKGA